MNNSIFQGHFLGHVEGDSRSEKTLMFDHDFIFKSS